MNFSVTRLRQLIINDLMCHKKIISVVILAFVLFNLLMPISMMSGFGEYTFLLYTVGLTISALAFNDLHNPLKSYQLLMLPCSNLERFLSKWLLTSIIYALGTLIIYYVCSLLKIGLTVFVLREFMPPLTLIQWPLWLSIGKYICLQSLFLLGAITFKKHPLIKTSIVTTLLPVALFVFAWCLSWLICPHCTHISDIMNTLLNGLITAFEIALAPVCWYVTYVKLTEYELR